MICNGHFIRPHHQWLSYYHYRIISMWEKSKSLLICKFGGDTCDATMHALIVWRMVSPSWRVIRYGVTIIRERPLSSNMQMMLLNWTSEYLFDICEYQYPFSATTAFKFKSHFSYSSANAIVQIISEYH